ncbi:hypothetical protein B0H12DRAFT_458450 [Mycena haematopus]|nr:hypothetical protein B0H12DRAFT_458450 [Mycena haematopus]
MDVAAVSFTPGSAPAQRASDDPRISRALFAPRPESPTRLRIGPPLDGHRPVSFTPPTVHSIDPRAVSGARMKQNNQAPRRRAARFGLNDRPKGYLDPKAMTFR